STRPSALGKRDGFADQDRRRGTASLRSCGAGGPARAIRAACRKSSPRQPLGQLVALSGGRQAVPGQQAIYKRRMGLMGVTEIGGDQVEVAVDARVQLGEGPLWDEREGVLWWVDINAGHVHRFDPATGQDRFFQVDQTVGAVALRTAGSELVLAARHGFL